MSAFSPRMIAVQQGRHEVSRDPEVTLSAVLGSCVAACLYDPERGIGGMNHYLLPAAVNGTGEERKYGAQAMELLVNALLRAGARRESLQAKIFGGATLSTGFDGIGRANAEFGRTFLRLEGFEIRAESLGGRHARRITFHPASGRARQLIVPNADLDQSLPPRPRPERAEGGVTLF